MPLYFANYCPSHTSDRATEVSVNYRLKDARAFMKGKRGYIIRQADSDEPMQNGENTFQEWCGGFQPTAHDEQIINELLRV